MLSPSRQVVISLALTAVACLALGLATDVGLFGWSLALLLGVYLGVAAIARRRSHSTRRRPASPSHSN